MTIAEAWDAIQIEPWRPLKTEGVFKLTPINDNHVCEGTTGFFRHLVAHDMLISYLLGTHIRHDPRILFAPCSVGCEPLTFLMRAHERGLLEKYPDIKVYALDVSEVYLTAGSTHAYPDAMGRHLARRVRETFFHATHDKGRVFLSVNDAIAKHIEFLPPQDLMNYHASQPFDAVLSMHLLEHVLHVADHSELVLKGLVGNAKLAFVSPAYFIPLSALQRTFESVSKEAVFSELDRNMQPGKKLGYRDDLSGFQKPRGPDGETFIYRHDI